MERLMADGFERPLRVRSLPGKAETLKVGLIISFLRSSTKAVWVQAA